jgi:hypothetical protein
MEYRVVQPYGRKRGEWTLISAHESVREAFDALDELSARARSRGHGAIDSRSCGDHNLADDHGLSKDYRQDPSSLENRSATMTTYRLDESGSRIGATKESFWSVAVKKKA